MRKLQQDNERIFQSTHPVRGGTKCWVCKQDVGVISIHPPREGWDHSRSRKGCLPRDFNPPTP